MNKPNIFKSSRFFMDAGDVLHILIKDLVGTGVTIGLNDGDGNEEDSEPIGFTTTLAPTTTVSTDLVDRDGNIYTTVIIGTQEWIVENFRSATYADDSAIPNLTDDGDWIADVTGAYCYYDNDEATYGSDYGIIYNWYAVDNAHGLAYLERGGIEEAGWRIPSSVELDALITLLGGDGLAPGKLAEEGTSHWTVDNGQTNESGFTLVGSGYRNGSDGTFGYIKTACYLWTSTEYSALSAWGRFIYNNTIDRDANNEIKQLGMVVRLVRDI